MARPERPRRSFTMHQQRPFRIPFDFGDIMSHVIDLTHTQVLRRLLENCTKSLANLMGNHLPIRKGRVGRTIHRRKIVLPFPRPERGTRQLPILDDQAGTFRGLFKTSDVIGPDLMAEPSRPTMNHNHNLVMTMNP